MTTIPHPARATVAGKPVQGRPALFVALLALAALGVLMLLIAGPSFPLPIALLAALGAGTLVVLAWVVAGPRL